MSGKPGRPPKYGETLIPMIFRIPGGLKYRLSLAYREAKGKGVFERLKRRGIKIESVNDLILFAVDKIVNALETGNNIL